MTVTERLLDATKELWDQYNEHPFVLGIMNGDLDKEKFRFYMLQDYLYLNDYARTFAVGVAKATNHKTANLFAKYVGVMNGELNVHEGYLGRFGITQEEIDSTPVSFDNMLYTSYMLRIAYECGEAEIMAAILSCALSYEVIAKKMIETKPDCVSDEFYGEWIVNYASERYEEDNRVLSDEMDRLARNYSEEQIKKLIEIFTISSRCEMSFWDMAWEMKK